MNRHGLDTYRAGRQNFGVGQMNLRDWRKSNDLTKVAVARLIGVVPISIGRYEAGRVPDPPTLRRIMEVTAGAVTPNDFFAAPEACEQGEDSAAQPLRSTNQDGKAA